MNEPSSRLVNIAPIFPVADLAEALAHYQRLGFATNAYGSNAEADYGFADRDGTSIHLAMEKGHDHSQGGAAAFLYVEDADALFEQWSRAGVGGDTRRVVDTEYQLREGAHIDPDGNLIRFGSPMPAEIVNHLRTCLEENWGLSPTDFSELDQGTWQVRCENSTDVVARHLPTHFPIERVDREAALLEVIHQQGFPGEKVFSSHPTAMLDGRPVLLTEWIPGPPRAQRRDAIRNAGGLARLGELCGRLQVMEIPDQLQFPGGAWHHLAIGDPSAEVVAAVRLLRQRQAITTPAERPDLEQLISLTEDLDVGSGLPQALCHPDLVMNNVVAGEDGLHLVDWTGVGMGPRIWALAWLLWSQGTRNLDRVDIVLSRYLSQVALSEEEMHRLGAVMRARPLILDAWRTARGSIKAPAVLGAATGREERIDLIVARARTLNS